MFAVTLYALSLKEGLKSCKSPAHSQALIYPSENEQNNGHKVF